VIIEGAKFPKPFKTCWQILRFPFSQGAGPFKPIRSKEEHGIPNTPIFNHLYTFGIGELHGVQEVWNPRKRGD